MKLGYIIGIIGFGIFGLLQAGFAWLFLLDLTVLLI